LRFITAAVAAGIALGTAPFASALPNQDDNLLCYSSDVAFQDATAHQTDCSTAYIITGRLGHATVSALSQTFYPLAMPTLPTLTPPAVPKAQVCAYPSKTPRC
jgi:hypothetical protein